MLRRSLSASLLLASALVTTSCLDRDLTMTAPSASAVADGPAVVRGQNTFAVELYRRLSQEQGNLFFSPESILVVLAMTYAGARGETAREMAQTLQQTLPPERLAPALAGLLYQLQAGARQGNDQLRWADALWVQEGFPVLPTFAKLLRDHYGAFCQSMDMRFQRQESSRLKMNRWVEQQTDGKITDLIPPGLLTNWTRLVLVNAIYFRGDWETRFDAEKTTEQDFHVTPTHTVRAKLMEREGRFSYFNDKTFSALELPYQGKDLSMVVFLPQAVDGLPVFEQSMSAARVESWLSRLHAPATSQVRVSLPRFNMSFRVNLSQSLQQMGMQSAFNEEKADFSGMTGRRGLFLGFALHKAYIRVNEQGTEAAAATAVGGVVKTAVITPPPVFRADHPFVFLLRDHRSGSILFLGRLVDPSL